MSTVTSVSRRLQPLLDEKSFAARAVSWFNQLAPRTMVEDEPIPTRASLLRRLKDPADQAGWEEFLRTYRGLIHGVARRAGLNETEAEEVLQETLIAVAREVPEFGYDPARDSFKGWLLQITRWRIADQFRKRTVGHLKSATVPAAGLHSSVGSSYSETGTRTATVERVADPAGPELSAIWDEEWHKHVLTEALTRIKRRVNPAHYEIFHLHVILGQSVSEVKRTLRVNAGQIYLARHRVGSLLKREIRKLEAELR